MLFLSRFAKNQDRKHHPCDRPWIRRGVFRRMCRARVALESRAITPICDFQQSARNVHVNSKTKCVCVSVGVFLLLKVAIDLCFGDRTCGARLLTRQDEV